MEILKQIYNVNHECFDLLYSLIGIPKTTENYNKLYTLLKDYNEGDIDEKIKYGNLKSAANLTDEDMQLLFQDVATEFRNIYSRTEDEEINGVKYPNNNPKSIYAHSGYLVGGNAFYNDAKIKYIAHLDVRTSSLMNFCYSASALEYIDTSRWTLENVTNIVSAFSRVNIKELDFSNADLSHVVGVINLGAFSKSLTEFRLKLSPKISWDCFIHSSLSAESVKSISKALYNFHADNSSEESPASPQVKVNSATKAHLTDSLCLTTAEADAITDLCYLDDDGENYVSMEAYMYPFREVLVNSNKEYGYIIYNDTKIYVYSMTNNVYFVNGTPYRSSGGKVTVNGVVYQVYPYYVVTISDTYGTRYDIKNTDISCYPEDIEAKTYDYDEWDTFIGGIEYAENYCPLSESDLDEIIDTTRKTPISCKRLVDNKGWMMSV